MPTHDAVTLILWSHALAALLFAGVALSRLRGAGTALPRVPLVAALLLTALWALAVAGIDAHDISATLAESARNLGWLGFMFSLVRRDADARQRRAVTTIYAVVALVVIAGACLAVIDQTIIDRAADRPTPVDLVGLHADLLAKRFVSVSALFAAMVAISALVLVHHLHAAVISSARGGIRLVVVALAAMWGTDLLLHALSTRGPPAALLVGGRGVLMAGTAALFAVAVQRRGDWTLVLSRTMAWRTFALAVALSYAATMLAATSAIAAFGGGHARLLEAGFVVGATAAALTMVSSPWLKAWTRVQLTKHFFRHRYDYRAEWMRFTATLGQPGDDARLDERIVKAVADLTESPAGLLLVPDGDGLGVGEGWNWGDRPRGAQGIGAALAHDLRTRGRIIELDGVRARTAEPAELAQIPDWMLVSDGWALVPLVHVDRLQGAILLARPPVDRALDWEDFDLLRVAGRQVASYLAEARAQTALAEAQRFDEFNRRFAFILHDIKNLVSQLGLVARNAERHADNPAFRADMIASLKESAGRMNDLLARLSQHHHARAEPLRPTLLAALARRVASRHAAHGVTVDGDETLTALTDPARLDQLLTQLVHNATEASAAGSPITIRLALDDARPVIEVIDHGCGMSPGFIRDRLFKPFVSSKPGGFGIGAFEARQLAEAMGGSVSVTSREGFGSCFRVTLAAAPATRPGGVTAPDRALEHAV